MQFITVISNSVVVQGYSENSFVKCELKTQCLEKLRVLMSWYVMWSELGEESTEFCTRIQVTAPLSALAS